MAWTQNLLLSDSLEVQKPGECRYASWLCRTIIKKLLRENLWQARVVESLPDLRIIDQDANDPLSLPNARCTELQPPAEAQQPLQLSLSRGTQFVGTWGFLGHAHTGAQISHRAKPQIQVRISEATRTIFSRCSSSAPFHRSSSRASNIDNALPTC